MLKMVSLFGFNFVSYLYRKSTNLLSFPWLFINRAKYEQELVLTSKNKVRELKKLHPKNDYEIFRNKVRQIFLGENCHNFLRDSLIQQIMFIGNSYRTTIEFFKIYFLYKEFRYLLKEDNVGNPLPFWLYPNSSGNRIHHIFHLIKLINLNKKNLNEYDLIIEFGGGYGSFCRLSKLYNYKNDYLIFDFNEVNIMQFYYLKHFYKDIEINKKSKISLISEIKDLNTLLNNFYIDKKILFISHWAISETPLKTREEIFDITDKLKINYFIAFQEKFLNVNNSKYFDIKFKNKIKSKEEFTVNFEKHYYLYSENF